MHLTSENGAGVTELPPPRAATRATEEAPPQAAEERRWSRWSAAVLIGTALTLAGATVLHLAMLFLNVAPSNALTARHGERINAYVYPEFGQDWKLFAPNPQQRNEAVGVRLRIGGAGGPARTSRWINLTARDIEEIRGSLAPSHVHQNMLRRAWDRYAASHDDGDRRKPREDDVTAAYLKRVVLQRIGREWRGEPVTGVQIAGRFTVVSPPAWSSEAEPRTTDYRVLAWWPVTDRDYRGL